MGFHTFWIKRWYRIYGEKKKKKKTLVSHTFLWAKGKTLETKLSSLYPVLPLTHLISPFFVSIFLIHQNLFIFVYFSQFFDVYTPSLSWARNFSNSFIWEVHFVYFTVIQFYFILYKSRKKKPYFSLSLPVCLCV